MNFISGLFLGNKKHKNEFKQIKLNSKNLKSFDPTSFPFMNYTNKQ